MANSEDGSVDVDADEVESSADGEAEVENVDAPLNSALVDQKIQAAQAEARAERRQEIADALQEALRNLTVGNQPQAVQSEYMKVSEIPPPGQLIEVEVADNGDFAMERMDGQRAANVQERAPGGSNQVGEYGPAPAALAEVDPKTLLVDVASFKEAKDALEKQAQDLEKKQRQMEARAARDRRNHVISAVLGGIGFAGSLSAALFAIFANPEKVDSINAGDVDGGTGNDPTKAVTVDVVAKAIIIKDGNSVDPASVELLPNDGDGKEKTKTIADIGVWTAADDGKVTFTPDDKFPGGPVSILYSIADNEGNRSPRAAIVIDYRHKVIKGDGGPVVVDVTESHFINDTISIDVASLAKPGSLGAAVAANSIEFLAPDPTDLSVTKSFKSHFQAAAGTWSALDTGQVTFLPLQGFLGGRVSIKYTIKDASGKTSDSATLLLDFAARPQVFNILKDVPNFAANTAYSANVLDGSENVPEAFAAEGQSLDTGTLILTNVLKFDGEVRGPAVTTSNSFKTLTVEGEGVWDASDPSGVVTFTPSANLTEDPHPVVFQVADDKGVLSNASVLIFSAQATALEAALDGLNTADDDAFFKTFETQVVNAELGEDLVAALLLMRSVATTVWQNTRRAIGRDSSTNLDRVQKARDTLLDGILTREFTTWRSSAPGDKNDPLSPGKLFAMSEVMNDAKVDAADPGLSDVPLATRYIRLSYISQVLAIFNRVMFNIDAKSS